MKVVLVGINSQYFHSNLAPFHFPTNCREVMGFSSFSLSALINKLC